MKWIEDEYPHNRDPYKSYKLEGLTGLDIMISKWRNNDGTAEYNSWTVVICADYEKRLFFPPNTPIEQVKEAALTALVEKIKAYVTELIGAL